MLIKKVYKIFSASSTGTNILIWKQHLEILSFYTCAPYGFWDMEHNRQNILSFWPIFCPLTPLITRKIKILKKWNTRLGISPFYTSVTQMMTTRCMVPEIWSTTNKTFSHFGQSFFLFIPALADVIILHKNTINDNHMIYGYWDMERDRNNFLSFWVIFCPFTPQNFEKKKN